MWVSTFYRDSRPKCTERRCCEYAGSGDTHNDLRSTASLLSGDLVLWFRALCPNRFPHTHADWQTVSDYEFFNPEGLLSIEDLKHLRHIFLEDKNLTAA